MNFKQKARIALSSIAVFALVGGAFAVKARSTDKVWYNTTTTLPGTLTLSSVTLTTIGDEPIFATSVFGARVYTTFTKVGI